MAIQIEMDEKTGGAGFVFAAKGDDVFALVQANGEFAADRISVIGAARGGDADEEDFGGVVCGNCEACIPEQGRSAEGCAEIDGRGVCVWVPDPIGCLGESGSENTKAHEANREEGAGVESEVQVHE